MRPLFPPPNSDESLVVYLDRTGSTLTREQVLQQWTRAQLDRAVREGSVLRIIRGIYCASTHAKSAATLGHALNLWAPQGLVTGQLALALFEPTLTTPPQAHLVVPYGLHLRAPQWVCLLQRTALRAEYKAQSVRCVAPERALLDAWVAAPPSQRVDVFYDALWERVCTWKQLRRELDRAPRVRGRRELEELLGWFERGARSPLEVRAHRDVFIGPRFEELVWQEPLSVPGREAVADILHRRAKVVIELDGRKPHERRFESDRSRDIDLAAAGYLTIRLTWNDIVTRPQWCREQVLAVIASRLRTL